MDEDKMIKAVMALQEDVKQIKEEMVTRSSYDKHTSLLEGIANTVKKTQEDHVFTIEVYKKLRTQVDKQEDEIKKIKVELAMA